MMPDNSWIQVENLSGILDNFRPIIYHPDDPRYANHWRVLKAKCTNGIWVPQFGKLRYVPGRLGFFGVFGRFYSWTEQGERIVSTPDVRDLEWHRAYYTTEMDGFSGFFNDGLYTSDSAIFKASATSRKRLSQERWLHLFKENGQFKEYIPPRENLFMLHEDNGVDRGHALYYNEAKNHCELGARGGGKALTHNELCYNDLGEISIGDIKVGDKIFDDKGELTTVLEVFPQGKVPIYEITFKSGRKIQSCENHQWEVIAWNSKPSVKKTKDLLDFKRVRKKTYRNKGYELKYKVKVNKALQYSTKQYEIDPYLIGCLLGDGHIGKKTGQRLISITCHQDDLAHYLETIILPKDTKYRIHRKKNTNCYTIYISHLNGLLKVKNNNHLFEKLENMGLVKYSFQKSIPHKYFYGSIEQRTKLLQGLMDTDGWVDTKPTSSLINFGSTSIQLSKDVQRLARSLSYACSKIKTKKTTHKDFYRFSIYTDDKDIFSLQRKRDLIQKKKSNYSKSHMLYDYITDIKRVEDQEASCIMVDNDSHLFLTTNYVVTHNSYWTALGEILPDICLDGATYFNPNKPEIITRAEIEVTCGGGAKSSELLDKVEDGMNFLANRQFKELGVWEYNEDEVEACPFWKQMTGSIKVNNKDNPWTHKYEVQVGSRWVKKGNKDFVYNTQYTANSKGGAQKSAGGRRTRVIHEEFGLNTELLSAWGSNEGMITDNGRKMKGQKGIGTSGNMNTIGGAKKIMTNPKAFSCLTFKYTEEEGEFGFFLPTYMVDSECKDENGNTDVTAAKLKALAIRKEKADTGESSVYLEHIMNNPIYIADMWVQGSGNLLPALEAENREKELMKNNLYKSIGTHIKLYWNEAGTNGVSYDVLKQHEIQPFYDWPLEESRTTKEAIFTMYIHPSKLRVNGVIPNDAVLCVHDPYVSDEMEGGGSLGAAYFIVNPKYIPNGLPGNCIAATYIGKASGGVDKYNQVLELGLAFYGNPLNSLWYESNRGDKLRSYFLRKKKRNLLCYQPQFVQGQYIYKRNVTQTGYKVGNRVARISLIDSLSDWLLEETELHEEDSSVIKKNISRIPCIFTIRQIKQYNLDKNFDGVDALAGITLALGEQKHSLENKVQSKGFELFVNHFKRHYGNHGEVNFATKSIRKR